MSVNKIKYPRRDNFLDILDIIPRLTGEHNKITTSKEIDFYALELLYSVKSSRQLATERPG